MASGIYSIDELIEKLEVLAKRKTCTDDETEDEFFDPSDFGQYDNCYNGGIEDGETQLAREILAKLKGDK